MTDTLDAHANSRDYYGKQLQGSGDLKTNACSCSPEAIPLYQRRLMANIEDSVLERFYGCGSPLPEALEGLTVLDLGCGSGRDVYLAAQLVGEHGRVIGVDFTGEQLEVARAAEQAQRRRFGYAESNVSFVQSPIEDLATAGIADASVDLVISNCVINLCPDKEKVFTEILRVLRPGGELHFADVFADRRVPADLANDPVLHGECLGGAVYTEDFRRLLQRLGCPDYRETAVAPITISDPQMQRATGNIRFTSRTVRVFKLAGLEDRCEDFGQVARYLGTIPEQPHAFVLDDHHTFETGRAMPVCGNTAAMLGQTRFGAHFEVIGDRSTHYGLFDCAREMTPDQPGSSAGACGPGCC
jgi:SAM-dependent methyltransferase